MPSSPPEARSYAGLAAACLLAILISFAGIGSHSLWSPDEPTGAAVGPRMLDSRALILPRLHDEPSLAEAGAPAEARWARVLIAVAIPLGFLSKGVVASGLGAGPPVLYLLATRRGRAVRELALLAALGVPVFAFLVTPWALALYREAGWDGLKEGPIANTASRVAQTSQR